MSTNRVPRIVVMRSARAYDPIPTALSSGYRSCRDGRLSISLGDATQGADGRQSVGQQGCPRHPGAGSTRLLLVDHLGDAQRFEVVRCEECGLARTEPQLSPQELDRYYPSSYYGVSRRYRLDLDRSISLITRHRIRRIEIMTGGPGRVLDIGCGPGWLLSEMRERGWLTRGTERSRNALQHARDVLDLDVRAQDITELLAEGVSYDAVVLWHVLEHMHDPAAALRDICRLLRPGGVLMVAVPNFASPEARLGGVGWFHLDVPRHLFHFTPATLTELLASAGLVTRETGHIAPEYDLFSFVQTAENRLGLPRNLLYDLVRRREARLLQLRQGPGASLATLAAAIPLTAVGSLWAPLAAVLGLSATIIVYAQRPPETVS